MVSKSSQNEIYRFSGFEVNTADRLLSLNGQRLAITPRAFDLLVCLISAEGHLVGKETLLNEVWSDAIVEEGNLNRTISALRKVLGDTASGSRFIETVPKSGYRFVGKIETAIQEKQNAATGIGKLVESPGSLKKKYRWLFGIGSFVILFGGLLAAYFLVPRPATDAAATPPAMVRLTSGEFDEDMAVWTHDNQIRFIRYVTSTRAESWVMDADGSNERRANERIKDLLTGQWSPDGKQVVFVKEGEGPRNVYLANSDGSNERKLPLTYPPSDWSPDATKFVYATEVRSEDHDILIFDISSGKSINLTNNPAFDADPLFSSDGTQISFISSRDGNKDTYLMNADGSNVRRITDNPAVDAFPVVSPDGTQILFDSNRSGENIDLYFRNINDDLPPIKLTDLPSNEEHRGHCWSPDGTKVVITSDQGGKSNVFVLSVEPFTPKLFLQNTDGDLQYPSLSRDGSKLSYQVRSRRPNLVLRVRDLDKRADRTLFESSPGVVDTPLNPSFSPDGSKIIFTARDGDNSEIFAINIDGTGLTNLTQNGAADSAPMFSNDGKEIFFQSNREGGFERFHLFRMNADGSEQRRITNRGGYEFSAVPIPATTKIIFSGDRVDRGARALDIRVIDLQASGEEQILASRRFHDTQPTVSPSGDRIAFVAQSDGNSEIYLMRSDGSQLLRLTRNPASDRSPVFSSDGKKVYFESDRNGLSAIFTIDLPY